MAKKKTLKQASDDKKPPQLAESLAGSANEIWLAGLGAFSKAQSEGKKIFDKLIEQGKDFEQAFKSQSKKASKDIKSSVSGTVGSAKKKAAESWDKLESVFETRVEKSLHRLGVPTNDELNKLVDRIEKLTAQVSGLATDKNGSNENKAQSTTATKKKVTKKKAAKKKVSKKTADGVDVQAKSSAAKTAVSKDSANKKKISQKKTSKKTAKKTTKKKTVQK